MKATIEASHFDAKGRERTFAWWHLAFRLVWGVVWLLFASWTPPQLYAWRRFLLNLFGARLAKGARVYGSARIWYPPNLTMGRNAVLGWRVNCYSQGKIEIEAYATVSQFSHLVTGSHDTESAYFELFTKPILIRSHAWVASNAFIGPGVTIGEGAVAAAGAVVFRDLEPWTIYVGNPAKAIRPRHNFVVDGARPGDAGQR